MTIILPSDNSIAPHKFTDLSSEQNSIAFRLDYDLDNAIDPSNTDLLLSGLKAINKAKKVDSRIVKYSTPPMQTIKSSLRIRNIGFCLVLPIPIEASVISTMS